MQQTNWYTLLFAFAMSAVVALGLTSMREAWKDKQKANELLFNKSQILSSVMDVTPDTDVESIFDERVTGYLVNDNGEIGEEDTEQALEVSSPLELKKVQAQEKDLPIYLYESEEGETKYIIPTFGSGLWGWISSFVALENDKNTIAGIAFDHETETPGLGAKIKDDPGFYLDFVGEKIVNSEEEVVGVLVRKGNNDPVNNDKTDHTIDAISGATITGDGVEDMLASDLAEYREFLLADNTEKE